MQQVKIPSLWIFSLQTELTKVLDSQLFPLCCTYGWYNCPGPDTTLHEADADSGKTYQILPQVGGIRTVGSIALCKNNSYHNDFIGNVGKHSSRMKSKMEHKLPSLAVSAEPSNYFSPRETG